jgi:formylglycine-generating enzyme required for sulfatase activity
MRTVVRRVGAHGLSLVLTLIATVPPSSAGHAEAPEPGSTFADCHDCPRLSVVPPGRFLMGAPAGEEEREGVTPAARGLAAPQHPVTIARAFAISTSLITRGQYARFAGATHRPEGEACLGFEGPSEAMVPSGSTDAWKKIPALNWERSGFPQNDRHPVVCVSFNDATDYAAWLSKKTGKTYRLPNEVEWEYAARAGTTTARYWGNGAGGCKANLADLALKGRYPATTTYVNCDDGYVSTSPVGHYPPNPFGLDDMIGNVWQWVADCWTKGYDGAPAVDAKRVDGDCTKSIIRGGSWADDPSLARAAARFGEARTLRSPALGFRVVRDLD